MTKNDGMNDSEALLSDAHYTILVQSGLFKSVLKPVFILIRSMIFDTFVALSILIAYFYSVLQLTQNHFGKLWDTIAIVILFAMVIQVIVVRFLGRTSYEFFRALNRGKPVSYTFAKSAFINLHVLPLNLTSSGLIMWSMGIMISAYWLRFHIDLTAEKVFLMGLGGLIAAIGTNSYAFFRVRNLIRPYLSIIGLILPSTILVPRPRLFRELLYTFLLLVSFTLAMTSVFHYSLTLKLIDLVDNYNATQIYTVITNFIDQTGIMILVLCGLSMALAIGLATSASKNIIFPLRKLSRMSRIIADGDLSQRIPYLSGDEVGMLAADFESMRLAMHKTIEEKEKAREALEVKNIELAMKIRDLQRLDEASRKFSSSIDYQEIVNSTLDSFLSAVPAEHGSLFLFEPEESKLVLSKVSGITSDISEISMSKREINWIEARPEPFTIEALEEGIRTPETIKKWKELWLKNSIGISVPLFMEGKPIGFVILGQKKDHSDYSEGEIRLLNTLANQAAIAINNAKLYEQATVDSLTQLYLRRYFHNRLREEIWRVQRYGHSLSLVMMDIDHFKRFNDTYGHPKGDRLLKHVGLMIKEVSRDTDIPARYGGEEFIILLPETTLDGAKRISERLRQTIAESAIEDPEYGDLSVTISAGVADFSNDDTFDGSTLIQKADKALYKAKENGRNMIITYDEL